MSVKFQLREREIIHGKSITILWILNFISLLDPRNTHIGLLTILCIIFKLPPLIMIPESKEKYHTALPCLFGVMNKMVTDFRIFIWTMVISRFFWERKRERERERERERFTIFFKREGGLHCQPDRLPWGWSQLDHQIVYQFKTYNEIQNDISLGYWNNFQRFQRLGIQISIDMIVIIKRERERGYTVSLLGC